MITVHPQPEQEVIGGGGVIAEQRPSRRNGAHTAEEEKKRQKKASQRAVTGVDAAAARLTSEALVVTLPAVDTEPPPLPTAAPLLVDAVAAAGFAAMLDPDPDSFCKRTRITPHTGHTRI